MAWSFFKDSIDILKKKSAILNIGKYTNLKLKINGCFGNEIINSYL